MKKISILEYNNITSALTYAYCTSEKAHEEISTLELFEDIWIDEKNKSLFKEFKSVASQKGFKAAYYSLQNKYNGFTDINFDDIEIKNLKDVESIVQYNSKLNHAKQLAQRLVLEPERIDEIVLQLNNLGSKSNIDEYSVKGFMQQAFYDNEQKIKDGKAKVILPDFKLFSEAIGGFNPKRVSLIAAKSGFGKTKLAINLADSARKIMPVYYFNMEMGPEDFESQFIQRAANITYNQYTSGKYDEGSLKRILDYQHDLEKTNDITFTGGKAVDIDKVFSIILSKFNKQSGFIIVDYDQKLTQRSKDEEWLAILKAVERLEEAAKITGTHIVLLMQADDNGDAKSSKRAKQPASSMTSFEKDQQGNYVLRNIKNRFGITGFELIVEYSPEFTSVVEVRMKNEKDKMLESPNIDKAIRKRRDVHS